MCERAIGRICWIQNWGFVSLFFLKEAAFALRFKKKKKLWSNPPSTVGDGIMPAAGVVCCLVTIAGSLVMGDTADELHPGVHMFHSSPKLKVEAPSVFKICFVLYTQPHSRFQELGYTLFSVFGSILQVGEHARHSKYRIDSERGWMRADLCFWVLKSFVHAQTYGLQADSVNGHQKTVLMM